MTQVTCSECKQSWCNFSSSPTTYDVLYDLLDRTDSCLRVDAQLKALGLDSEMTVEELQLRVRAGSEVVRIHDLYAANGLGRSPVSYLLENDSTQENSETT